MRLYVRFAAVLAIVLLGIVALGLSGAANTPASLASLDDAALPR